MNEIDDEQMTSNLIVREITRATLPSLQKQGKPTRLIWLTLAVLVALGFISQVFI